MTSCASGAWPLTAAESSSGPGCSSRLWLISPGASAVLPGGFVTYSIEEKSKMLRNPLKPELREHGVVSAHTAERMAAQARCS
ncbi:MAG: CinA family protein [Streptococcus parasanguinis]